MVVVVEFHEGGGNERKPKFCNVIYVCQVTTHLSSNVFCVISSEIKCFEFFYIVNVLFFLSLYFK